MNTTVGIRPSTACLIKGNVTCVLCVPYPWALSSAQGHRVAIRQASLTRPDLHYRRSPPQGCIVIPSNHVATHYRMAALKPTSRGPIETREGFEPTTPQVAAGCSTAELTCRRYQKPPYGQGMVPLRPRSAVSFARLIASFTSSPGSSSTSTVRRSFSYIAVFLREEYSILETLIVTPFAGLQGIEPWTAVPYAACFATSTTDPLQRTGEDSHLAPPTTPELKQRYIVVP